MDGITDLEKFLIQHDGIYPNIFLVEEHSLAMWVYMQKKAYSAHDLPMERIRILSRLSGWKASSLFRGGGCPRGTSKLELVTTMVKMHKN